MLMEEVAATKISGEEDRYSHTDLWDFQANFDGSRKIFELFRPLLGKNDKAFVDKVEANFATVDKILAKYKTPEGFQTYDKLTDADRQGAGGGGQYACRGSVHLARQARPRLSPAPFCSTANLRRRALVRT
ncbi:MAG: imelysin family protein [Rhodospirillales bacterium]